MASILIQNGRVWNGETFFYADILVKNGKIERIAKDIDERVDFRYDATGKTVSAGLVDAHVHLRGISSDEFGIPADSTCFPFGVTAAADASGLKGGKDVLNAFAVKCVTFADSAIRQNRADLSYVERNLALFGERAAGVKVYFDKGVSDVSDTAPLRQICELAHERKLRVMVHCAGAPTPMSDILDVLGCGDILTHAFHGGASSAAEDGFASLRRAQVRGVIIDVGTAGHIHTDFAVFAAAVRQGICPDLISTDITCKSAFYRGGRYGLTMCMSIARRLGMDENSIFRAVTSNPARALGREREWGRLLEGGCADLAVIAEAPEHFSLTDAAGNHLEADTGYRCDLTVANGQIVYRN